MIRIALVLLLLFGGGGYFLVEAPKYLLPQEITISAGRSDGAYMKRAKELAVHLQREGVTLNILESPGSAANFERLLKDDEVDLAIMQGGVGDRETAKGKIKSLGSLYYEPLWLFVRHDLDVSDPNQLRGKRVAIGPDGSGIQALFSLLLRENGLSISEFETSTKSGMTAAQALLEGEVDGAVFVTASGQEYINFLLDSPDVQLVDFQRAEGYSRRNRFLSAIILPQGAIDMKTNAPPVDEHLIAPTAQLVARSDLDPAIESLLLQAATEIFWPGDVFAAPHRFPSSDYAYFDLSPMAKRYYDRGGPSFLQRVMPYWAAEIDSIDHPWVIVIFSFGTFLLLPLLSYIPPAYDWQMRRRIEKWYEKLRKLELAGGDAQTPAERIEVLNALDDLYHRVADINVPVTYNNNIYHLRMHIRLVNEAVRQDHLLDAPHHEY